MTAARVLLASFLLHCAASAQEPPTPRAEPSPNAPLGRRLEWTDAEGKPFWYRLPKKLDRAKPPALVLMLHGTGMKWGWAFWNYPIDDGGFRRDDIVVAPEGMTDGGNGTFNFVQGKAEGDHVAGLIGFFKKRFPVGKVYLYGHSQGAFFAYWFAGEHPELVDGIVAHAGNVLGNVKHPRAAKEKVAIGILHGRADAVVPVDCAYASEKVYKEQGYKKVKLVVVEGLTEQTGHWPLPKHASDLFSWLDQVSTDTARGATLVALRELAAEAPDVEVLASSAAAAERLARSAKPDEKAIVAEQSAALGALVADLVLKHAAAIAARPDSRRTDAPHGPWAAHFRVANRGLDSVAAWHAAAKDLRTRAASHEKLVLAAAAKLEKSGGGALQEAVKALETAFLAPGYDDLLARCARLVESNAKGVKPEDAAKLKSLAGGRRADSEQGSAAAAAIAKDAAEAFRKAHPAWFEASVSER
jgi:predicted esterase